jgi:hypothetical protein
MMSNKAKVSSLKVILSIILSPRVMKKIILVTLFLMVSVLVHAQTLKKEIIANAGASFTSSEVGLFWTIGEPMIATYSNTVDLFEGFHTPEDDINTSTQKLADTITLSLFPNPNNGVFEIELKGNQMPVHYEIINTSGVQMLQGQFTQNVWSFDMENIPSGVYYLSLKNNSISESISFVKF